MIKQIELSEQRHELDQTKNKEHRRDPEAHSVKKAKDWKFGYKVHVGVDSEGGLIHSLEVTSANAHDVAMTSELLTCEGGICIQ